MTLKRHLQLLPLTLYKMLFTSFFYWYFVAQGLFVTLVLIGDVFFRIDYYINNSVSILNILYLTFLGIPKGAWMTMPPAIMFGVIMSLGSFFQNNELIAIFTCGISLIKFTIPIILFNFLLSIFMIFGDSYIVIPTARYKERRFEELTESGDSELHRKITIRGATGDYFWHANSFRSDKNMLSKVIIITLDDKSHIKKLLEAESAVYTKTGWVFKSVTVHQWDQSGDLVKQEYFTKQNIPYPEHPDIFKTSGLVIENMTIKEAKSKLNQLKAINVFHNREKTEYYKKFAFPFTLLIVSLFAIGVCTISRVNVLLIAMFFSIGLTVIYYIMQLIINVLANTGRIYPLLGAWLPIIIILPITLYLVSKAKS
ncbi:MAG: LptF/LptG family permease [Spirochaetes bacterium]|nr:LptF/LptG family permease [Spirochaetota bacterium]